MNKYIGLSLIALSMGLASCDDFLDTLPDNRTEANTEEKIERLLVSAYPVKNHITLTEFSSDNMDDMGESNPNTERILDEIWHWKDVTESSDEAPEDFWESCYQCVETANLALEGIEQMGGATTTALKEAKAEALLCRAYAHFLLVNIFAQHYDSNNPEAIGVSYITSTETELNPQYQRETVHENYKHIAADLEAALPDVGDSYHTVPKYHFNKNAAYAFATRFYLYYEKYDKVIDFANRILGSNPKTMLRDYEYMSTITRSEDAYTLHYIDASLNCNIMLLTTYGSVGWYFGNYYDGKRYTHNRYIGEHETLNGVAGLWNGDYTSYFYEVGRYEGTNINTWLYWHMPFGRSVFEYTDPVAGIGYRHSVYNAFTGDEVLLNRAEAYTMTREFDKAAADLTLWMQNASRTASRSGMTLTADYIKDYMNSINYSYDVYEDVNGTEQLVSSRGIYSTLKKHLNPKFTIDAEGSVQESLIQCVLGMRRIDTLHEGKRWFDIKRWGIVIPRRVLDSAGNPSEAIDWLEIDDPRRAVQIPQRVREAGYQPNARGVATDNNASMLPSNYLK